MKKIVIILLSIFTLNSIVLSQTIEKLVTTTDIKHIEYHSGQGSFPEGLYVDEFEESFVVNSPKMDSLYFIKILSPTLVKINMVYCNTPRTVKLKLGNDYWGESLQPMLNGEYLSYINTANGISFILKKDSGYIVYYIDKNGIPGAVDTTGRIYSSEEAMAYLKEYDPEKYRQSEKRAAELELYNDFIRNRVLIWGKRYYKPIEGGSLYQYDNQGNRYGCNFFWWGNYKNDWGTFCEVGTESTSNLFCFDINEERFIFDTTLNNYSTILGRNGDYQETRPEYSTSWYVGFGGNI